MLELKKCAHVHHYLKCAVLKIPIARLPEATCFMTGAIYSKRQVALGGDLKSPYLNWIL